MEKMRGGGPMSEGNNDFNVWEFWEKIKGVRSAEKLKTFFDEFLDKTKGRKLTEDEMTIEVYLKARIGSDGIMTIVA